MKDVYFVGIDVDDKLYHGCVCDKKGNNIRQFTCKPNFLQLSKKLKEIAPLEQIKVCYEATYIGFSLFRELKHFGIHCDVIAPALIPKLPGKKIKTDKLDSAALAKYYSQGLLTPIHVPSSQQQADRDLVRSRHFLARLIAKLKNNINSSCKLQGWNYKDETKLISYWNKSHRTWLDRKIAACSNLSTNLALNLMLKQLRQMEENLLEMDQSITELSQSELYKKRINVLKAFRGLDTASAMALVTEIGDIKRFNHPRRLTSYSGLDIKECSSGGKEKKQGITKMGNFHIRRILVESCQYALQPPRVSRSLKIRREGVSGEFIDIADKCMSRLHKKSTKLLFRGKQKNKVKTACAREMLGFIWEALMKSS